MKLPRHRSSQECLECLGCLLTAKELVMGELGKRYIYREQPVQLGLYKATLPRAASALVWHESRDKDLVSWPNYLGARHPWVD